MKSRQAKKIIRRSTNDHCRMKRTHKKTDPFMTNGIGYCPTHVTAVYGRGTFYQAQYRYYKQEN